MKPTPSALLALVFALALGFLVGGRGGHAVQASAAAGPLIGSLPAAPDSAAAPAGEALDLSVTVGTDPGVCAATNAISVTVGTLVNVCYEVTNNTAVTLTTHGLRDQLVDDILNDFPYSLAPGASAFITRALTATTATDIDAVWTATLPTADYDIITGTCTFPNIAATGQALNLTDDGEVNITLPFHFSFYDRYTNRLRVANNGGLLFDEPDSDVFAGNAALPTTNLPHGLAVFWDDLDDETGQVYAGLFTYTAASQAAAPFEVQSAAGLTPQGATSYYVIHYHQRSHFPGPSDTGTFSVGLILPGQGLDGYIFACYPDTNFGNAGYNYGASATLGVNRNGSSAAQYSFNTARPELTGNFGVGYRPDTTPLGYVGMAAARIFIVKNSFLPVAFR